MLKQQRESDECDADRKFDATTHRTLAIITITAVAVILIIKWLA